MAEHWETYAKKWQPGTVLPQVLPDVRVEYLGDEWTASAHKELGGHAYGLTREAVGDFKGFITKHLLDPYLPTASAEGLELGPGGGKLTALLLPRTEILHAAEPSRAMLRHLERRFSNTDNLRLHHTDGMTVPPLRPSSLDYVFAFDVFIHFEPRLVYWYLCQIKDLLKPGGIRIITYANVLTSLGWHKFEKELEENLQRRTEPVAFGVMCPQLMDRFLQVLQMEIISTDLGLIPRDSVAVFRKPLDD